MDHILYSITTEHDARWLLAAALICVLGLSTAMQLLGVGREQTGIRRRNTTMLAALISGLAVFTTHFVALHGYQPGHEIRYAVWPTVGSFVLALGSFGLAEAIDMLSAQGLDRVFARHQRWAAGVRAAVTTWGLPIQCADPAVHSPVLTGVITPPGVDADAVRQLIHQRFDLSLGTGLGKIKGRMFRIGHLGDSNDLTLLATLAGCEMGMKLAGITLRGSGVQAAMDHFAATPAA